MKLDEKKLYQKNTIGYNLVIVFVILNTVYTIFTLKNMAVNYSIGTFVMTNILLSMIGFLTAVKLRIYSIRWSYVSIGIGVFQAIRFFFMPVDWIGNIKVYLSIILEIGALIILIAGIVSLIKANKRTRYIIKHNISEELLSK